MEPILSEAEIVSWVYQVRQRAVSQYVCRNATPESHFPAKGTYLVTGMQMHSHYNSYVGYVVQIRQQPSGDIWLLRHPDGVLMQHSNQMFFELNSKDTQIAISQIFPPHLTPQLESTEPYMVPNGAPETDFIVPYYDSFHERVKQASLNTPTE